MGTALQPLDPMLGPHRANGGPTHTHALLEKSPAIDAGSPETELLQDQRGFLRPVANKIDIGAFEQN